MQLQVQYFGQGYINRKKGRPGDQTTNLSTGSRCALHVRGDRWEGVPLIANTLREIADCLKNNYCLISPESICISQLNSSVMCQGLNSSCCIWNIKLRLLSTCCYCYFLINMRLWLYSQCKQLISISVYLQLIIIIANRLHVTASLSPFSCRLLFNHLITKKI